ncbi:ABC transporter ATP-binding protein [Hippea sp. KM1]|uniref:ABC transporter ATP-binding protein n=1 Tax=Hippea sp. KM1 TaxID=944481 RepID=UPI00046CB5FD|nr:ATP-binding cassette domain-containing protein [Hippea sp. KM1]
MIKIEIKKRFEKLHIDVCMEFKGLKNVIFGPSGSGKSSILKMIAGFYDPDDGVIALKGEKLFDKREGLSIPVHKRGIGYVPQEYTLFPHLNVMENLLYPARVKGIEVDRGLFDALIEKSNIKEHLYSYPHQLSGGQKQRVAIIRAILSKPKLLLLDEPFSALDRPVAEELGYFLIRIIDEIGLPSIFVSHNLEEAFMFAQQMAFIKDGRVLELSDKLDVFLRPRCVETAIAVGFRNIFKADECTSGRVRIGEFWFDIEDGCSEFFCIRPDEIIILRDDVDTSDKENRIEAEILSITCMGGFSVVRLKSKGLFFIVHLPNHAAGKMDLKSKKRVFVSLKKDSLIGCSSCEGDR